MRPYAHLRYVSCCTRISGGNRKGKNVRKRERREERRAARRVAKLDIARQLGNARLYGLVLWDGLHEAEVVRTRGKRMGRLARLHRKNERDAQRAEAWLIENIRTTPNRHYVYVTVV